MKRNHGTISKNDFYCTNCGERGIPLARTGRRRECGHLKKLYCLNCNGEYNHAEVKGKYTKEVFKKEFTLGRFVNGERIPSSLLKSCKEECKYNVDGKCWNANCSFECDKRKENKNA